MDNHSPESLPPVNTPENIEGAGPDVSQEQELSRASRPEIIRPKMDTPGSAQPKDDTVAPILSSVDETIDQETPPPTAPREGKLLSQAVSGKTDIPDKVWVRRAKKIVEDTRHDPYEQGERVVALKEDYQAHIADIQEDKAA